MKKLIACVALATVAGVPAAQAQTPETPPVQGPVIVHAAPYPCDDCMPRRGGLIHRLIDRFERHGCGYGKTHHDAGCLGIRAHAVFIFGNCQQYFQEPCNKQPQGLRLHKR